MRVPAQLVLVLAFVLASCTAAGKEDDEIRGSLQQTRCENTVGGRWLVADDAGMVCKRSGLDYATGCCAEGERHSCATCSDGDGCCSEYEHCVSCCLRPDHKPQKRMEQSFRGMNKPETGLWQSPFEYCRAACRTTSLSTEHENAFILDRRFCYSKLGRPRVPAPPTSPLPANVTVRVGGEGQSCDGACGDHAGACAAVHLPALNSCNALRERFMCEAGCGESNPDQLEFPGYVVAKAPKHQWPAVCAVLPGGAEDAAPAFNCSHSVPHVRRLCPCEPAAVVFVVPPEKRGDAPPRGAGDAAAGDAAAGDAAAGGAAAGAGAAGGAGGAAGGAGAGAGAGGAGAGAGAAGAAQQPQVAAAVQQQAAAAQAKAGSAQQQVAQQGVAAQQQAAAVNQATVAQQAASQQHAASAQQVQDGAGAQQVQQQ